MYMTMSISTGLYPKLDLLTANKLLTYLPRARAGRPTCERGGNQQRNQRALQKDSKKCSVK